MRQIVQLLIIMKLTQLIKLSKNGLNSLKIAIFFSFLIVAIPTQVKAASINILNHSFEGPEAPLNRFGGFSIGGGNINSWVASSTTGVLNPSKSDANATSDSIIFDSYYDEPVPDGVQVAWGNEDATIFQRLSATLESNTKYTLGVYVGQRNRSGFVGYNIELLAGNTVLASNNSITPDPGTFSLVNVHYTSSNNDPLIGQALGIRLSSSGIQTNFDNVTLDATAVPEPLTILGVGTAIGFGTIFKRKIAKSKSKK